MKIDGFYYMHQNNDLIYKVAYDDKVIDDLVESTFVEVIWKINLSDRMICWNILIESLCLGVKESRVFELANKWGCDDKDADEFAKRSGLIFHEMQYGSFKWAVNTKDIQDKEDPPIGFGTTKLEAMGDLCKLLGYIKTKRFENRICFSDLTKKESDVSNY